MVIFFFGLGRVTFLVGWSSTLTGETSSSAIEYSPATVWKIKQNVEERWNFNIENRYVFRIILNQSFFPI